jgi:DNA-binding protein HU-beta
MALSYFITKKNKIKEIYKNMTKTEFISEVATRVNVSKLQAEDLVKAFLETVEETLVKDDRLQLTGFGTFEVVERAAREGRNPKDGTPLRIEASKSPKFKPGKSLKDSLNR